MNSTHAALQHELDQQSFWKGLSSFDWLWAIIVVLGTGYAYTRYASLMDGYEKGILVSTGASLIALGWNWIEIRALSLVVFLWSIFAISRYVHGLAAAEADFFLRFLV